MTEDFLRTIKLAKVSTLCSKCGIEFTKPNGSPNIFCEGCKEPKPQPEPTKTVQSEDVDLLLIEEILSRRKIGIQQYGTPLNTHNGRDALRDLLDELLDACKYCIQAIKERDSLHGGK